ncbi:nickel transporter [Kitasatospora sp. NPDC096147]|uniref:nickel transporter n=1 Tax=Kitasatospora sp. NPDC096147 TaxID=3364093 RepID=UPI0038135ECD
MAGIGLAALLLPAAAEAHPLGNFSVNRYDGLRLKPDRIHDSLVLDSAEIPTAQDRAAADRDHDGTVDPSEADDRAGQRCAELAGAVRANVGGRESAWQVDASSLAYLPGVAGLPTARLSCELSAAADLTQPVRVSFRSGEDHALPGWKEITAVGEGVALREGTVPRKSSSDGLRSYPADSIERPLAVVAAELAADGASGAAAPPSGEPGGRRQLPSGRRSVERRAVPAGAVGLPPMGRVERHLAALATARDLTVPVGLAAIGLALLLGAGHAALPGHATLALAACLARDGGRRRGGGVRSALAAGARVTAARTAGVLVVGLLLTTSTALAGERLLSGLGLAGGALVALTGVVLLVSGVRALPGYRVLTRGQRALAAQAGRCAAPAGDHDDLLGAEDGQGHGPAPRPGLPGRGRPEQEASGARWTGTGRYPEVDHRREEPTPPADADADGLAPARARVRARRLGRFRPTVVLGFGTAGGPVPASSVLVVLLAAVALGGTAFGVLLVLGYGFGMALALTVAGLLLPGGSTRPAVLAARYAPALGRCLRLGGLLTGLVVLAVGLGLVLRGASGL